LKVITVNIKIAIAHVADSRPDFYATRKGKVEEEMAQMEWIRERFDTIESDIIQSRQDASEFAKRVADFDAQSLIIHIPIWADPVLSMAVTNFISLPVMVVGNSRPETSSLVGILGAGGALDQTGHRHLRVFDQKSVSGKKSITAFVKAAAAKKILSGQVLGLFGGRSLGILTAVADPAQWQRTFGVDIETVDQFDIVSEAEAIDSQEVAEYVEWFRSSLKEVHFNDHFTPKNLERQVRSYMAMNNLIEKYGFDFVGVKCQTELSDGYVSQCVAHMLLNGERDLNGLKEPLVHACESDADGALTMQILKLLSGNKPTALMDVRWFDSTNNLMVLANCGAVSASFNAKKEDPSGLSDVSMVPHAFGSGGGGALPFQVSPQDVTLARLCRRDGEYWMAIVPGTVTDGRDYKKLHTTPEFPKAFVKVNLKEDFWQKFGSNHLHMVTGDEVDALIDFCRLTGVRYELWS
jgi:L-fucose/D-arabinose isomerase